MGPRKPPAVPVPAQAGHGDHARAVLVLGLPLVGSHLAQFSLQLADTLMLGWYSVEALAASVLGVMAFFTLFVMGSGFAWAVMPMVARAAAAGEPAEVRRATRMGLWLSMGYALAVAPLMWWSGPTLRALGQEPALAALAQDYLRILILGLPPALLVMVLKSYLAALGHAQAVLWVTVVASVLNVFLNWVLIFGNLGAPELGLRGAAMASVVIHLASLVGLVAYAAWLPALRGYRLFQRIWRPDGQAMGAVFRLGWPIALTNLAESGLFAATAILMGLIGTLELAAHGIAIEVTAAVFMVYLGLSNAATVRAGRALGRGDGPNLRRGAVVVLGIALIVAALTMLVYLAVPTQLMGLFLAPDDPDRDAVIAIGVGLLVVAAIFQIADAAQVVALGLLRGLQDARVPMLIATVSYWGVGIPAGYGLGIVLGLGGEGIWAGLVIGLTLAAMLLIWRFWRSARRL